MNTVVSRSTVETNPDIILRGHDGGMSSQATIMLMKITGKLNCRSRNAKPECNKQNY